MYLSGPWHFLKLGDKIGSIWKFLPGSSKAFSFFAGQLDKSAEVILGSRRAIGECLCQISLVSVAKGSLSLRELAVVGIEGIGAST